ncbi:MAG: energy transducer TonB [Actinomycetota bacterium]
MKVISYQLSVVSWICFALTLCFSVSAQNNLLKIAILTPEKNEQSEKFAEKLEISLAGKFKVLDSSLSETAFLSSNPENPFNLGSEEAKIIGAAIGCDYFLLVKAQNLRRSSFEKKEYFESYAAIFVVSSRTGRLVFWKLTTFNSSKSNAADKLLFDSTTDLTGEISDKLPNIAKQELNEKTAKLEEIPDENSPDAKNFRSPLPYKKISPQYTALANLYGITATVDIEVDFDESGQIRRTEIVRWAGFGLDESVTETIRKMNWRPAEKNKKTLPIRVLLRYNFKKLIKDE